MYSGPYEINSTATASQYRSPTSDPIQYNVRDTTDKRNRKERRIADAQKRRERKRVLKS